MINFLSNHHIVQSPEWGIFKTKSGKRTYRIGEIQFSVHKLPLFPIKIGYCPKVNPFKIKWKELINTAKKEGLCVIKFDVPNILKISKDASRAEALFQRYCRRGLADTFAKRTILLSLNKTEEELLARMRSKTRYNIHLAQHKGVRVKEESNKKGLEIFIKLQKETAKRQQFYVHPDDYYRKLWEILNPQRMAYILVGYFRNEPLVAWLLFSYRGVLYYPYGGSTMKHRNLMASNLIGWEAILLGKKLGCKIFDMWGAGDPNDRTDSWFGFTQFKLGYGGELVEFIDSYDLVLRPFFYKIFTSFYKLSWRVLRIKKKL